MIKTMTSIALVSYGLSLSASALSSEQVTYLTLTKMKVQEIPQESPLLEQTLSEVSLDQQLPINETAVLIDQVVNLGQKIWTIVEKGRPVFAVKTQSASAVPEGVRSWNQLSGWKPSKSASFKISYENGFGMDVIEFSYRVMFTYGGSVNGRGLYVTGATIIPAELSVAWGYKFNSDVTIPTVVNIGSSESPVGGIQMNVNWEVDTVIKHHQQTSSYFVDGLGRLKIMN